MRAICRRVEADRGYPRLDQACILPGRQMRRCRGSAREQILLRLQVCLRDPGRRGVARGLSDLELYRSMRLPLHHNGPGNDAAALRYIAHAERHQVTTSKLAVNRQIEQRKLSRST